MRRVIKGVLLAGVLLVLQGCSEPRPGDAGAPAATVTVDKEAASVAGLDEAQAAWRGREYGSALEKYMALDLGGRSELRAERGRLLVTAGSFFIGLGELSSELQVELLGDWQEARSRGELDSWLVSAVSVIGAYERGEFPECLALSQWLTRDGPRGPIADRAWLSVAGSLWRFGRVEEATQLLEKFESKAKEDPILAMALLRLKGESMGLDVEWSGESLPPAEDPSLANAALVDRAWLELEAGDFATALATLRQYDPRVPYASEPLEDAEELKRNFHGISFLPLLGRICYHLAAEDLAAAAGSGVSDSGVLLRLGLSQLRLGDPEAAIVSLSALADAAAMEEPESYAAFQGAAGVAARGRALVALDRAEEGRAAWRSLPTDASLRSAALQACVSVQESMTSDLEGGVPRAVKAARALMATRAVTDADYRYRHRGALWVTAVLLKKGGPDEWELALALLRTVHNPSDGYDPAVVDPELLLALTRVYRANHDGMANNILARLRLHFLEAAPAHADLQYLTSATKDPGAVVPGDS